MRINYTQLLIISKKWSTNRGPFTSVERFCSILDPEFERYHGKMINLHPRITQFFTKRTNSRHLNTFGYSGPYKSISLRLELWGFLQAFRRKYTHVFFPYADYDFYYWQYFKKIFGLKVILWSFFSESELQHRFQNLNHFEKADLVLVAGKSQLKFIQSKNPTVNAVFFPIGVDTDFFTPGTHYEPLRLVHVGNNRRDFETLIKGLDIVYIKYPDLQVDLIGVSTVKERIPERPYLKIHNFLGDLDYRRILQSCNFALLSLEDGGSSNSLLELCSCGLPIIHTSMPNVEDYIKTHFSETFAKGDSDRLAELCIYFLKNPEIRKTYSSAARDNALMFDWKLLKKKFIELIDYY